ncbi:YehS family protein [Desulfomicrobium salsuginis]
MTNNDILRRLRYALNLDNAALLRLFDLGGHSLSPGDLDLLLKKDEEPGFVDCPDILLLAFLDGLVISRRGPRDQDTAESGELNNNLVLRKLRIALELKDADMLRILEAGGMKASKSELSALFRSPSHRNYMPCRDQLLRRFLAGLAAISREEL